MAIFAFPFDGQNVTEAQVALLYREIGEGIAGDVTGTAFKVTGDSTGMQVKVAAGNALVGGYYVINPDASTTVAIGASASNPRIDRVVLRPNLATNTVQILVIAGTPAASPVAPAITAGDLTLALVTVPASAATISAGNVTDDRRQLSPYWTTATRPTSPRLGRLGLNSTTGRWEYWNGSAWTDLGVDWSAVSGKPSTFPPSAHSHLAAEVNHPTLGGLGTWMSTAQNALNGKADLPLAGGRAVGDITGGHVIGFYWNGTRLVAKIDNTVDKHLLDTGDTITPSSQADGPTSAAYNRSATGSAPYYAVWMNADMQFMRNTSSRRYKADVKTATHDPADVLKLRPVTYRRRGDTSAPREFGLIAEEVAEILPDLVTYDYLPEDRDTKAGPLVPEAVRYDLIALALLDVIRDQQARIEALEARLDAS